MENDHIESVARELQKEIYRGRHSLWPKGPPPLVRMFDLESAAQVLGFQLETYPYLPWYENDGINREIAGMIDRDQNRIAIATKFKPNVVRFTGAHEVGHWTMHEDQVAHRDAPIEGLVVRPHMRSQLEREADHFAACYLMPRNLVRKIFEMRFRQFVPLVVNFDTAPMLRPHDPGSLLAEDFELLDRAALIASAKKFGTNLFTPIADVFGVSTKSMAIRLVELGLVKD